jgi:ribonuclease BN (tRNA processing enzyme)
MNARLFLFLGLFIMVAIGWVAAFVIWRAAELGEEIAPLEPREFNVLTLVAAGTGSDRENPTRLGPTMAVAWGNRVVLVDAGRGVAESLRQAGIPVTQPDTVFLTNLLPENTIGLDDLITTGWLQDRQQALRVVGPRGTQKLVDGLLTAHRAGLDAMGRALPLPDAGREVDVVEVDTDYDEELDGVRVRAASLQGGPLAALAWRFDRGRHSIVLSGTGWGADDLVAFADRADLLVHDGVYVPPVESIEETGVDVSPERLEAERMIHTDLESVGRLASRARVEGLVLVRLRPPPFFNAQLESLVSQTFTGRLYIPTDGEEIVP